VVAVAAENTVVVHAAVAHADLVALNAVVAQAAVALGALGAVHLVEGVMAAREAVVA
jgi:hypothetical protein